MSQIQVDNIYNKEATGSPSFPLGANVTGVITATTFKGGAEITSGTISATSVTAASGTFNGPVTIGGTLTYEDVTNIDSVGVITARTGIKVTGGGIDVTGGNIKANNILDVPTIRRQIQNSSILIAGGNATNDGANIALYGSTHSSQANNFEFRTSGVERLRIGSAGQIGLGGANYGTSGQVLTSQGASAAPQWADAAGGISEYDVWAVDADASGSSWDYAVIGSGSPFAVSIARCTTSQNPLFTKIGTGMSYSSGVWSFPSNGLWEINFTILHYNSGTLNTTLINVTTDNGSTWGPGNLTNQYQGIGQNYVNTSQYGELSLCSTVTISDTANQKIRFVLKNGGSESIYGSANALLTYWTFKKLA